MPDDYRLSIIGEGAIAGLSLYPFIKSQAYCGRLYDALLALIVLYETIITHPSQYVNPLTH